MADQYTKGPWKREDGFVFSEKTNQRIADCYCDEQPDMSNDRIEANAQLISVAPEMLDALKQISIIINAGADFQIGSKGRHSTLPQSLERLIAKAEGRKA